MPTDYFRDMRLSTFLAGILERTEKLDPMYATHPRLWRARTHTRARFPITSEKIWESVGRGRGGLPQSTQGPTQRHAPRGRAEEEAARRSQGTCAPAPAGGQPGWLQSEGPGKGQRWSRWETPPGPARRSPAPLAHEARRAAILLARRGPHRCAAELKRRKRGAALWF